MRILSCFFAALAISSITRAQPVRQIPPPGIVINAADKQEIQNGLAQLNAAIDSLRKFQNNAFTIEYLPDILIYQKALDYATRYDEFFTDKDILSAKNEIKDGLQRAHQLFAGTAPWTIQKGEIVRGYISIIDGSVQPYGLTIPENYSAAGDSFDLSLWFHGRGEKMGELNFIANTNSFVSTMPAMKNTIMLYPYGRYCNAFKFAGETDVWEALNAVKKQYHIRENGILVRGFSMGGAAVWQFAVHFPDKWVAANPGAGFSETYEFLRDLFKDTLHPTWYERKLWHLYDCTDYSSNLSHLPLVAYSGEIDPQMQAATMMKKAMATEGLPLIHIIGPNTAHSYHKEAAIQVDSLLNQVMVKGKNANPDEIHFTTYTLKYNSMYCLAIEAMKEHWEKARIDANITGQIIQIKTINVSALGVVLSKLPVNLRKNGPLELVIDGDSLRIDHPKENMTFHLDKTKWVTGSPSLSLIKKHDLQGPIDDAFMSRFIVVRPTGKSANSLFDNWCKSEMQRFILQWRSQFRGDPIVKDDTSITKKDIESNLVLFGDPQSNQVLAKISLKLPITWSSKDIKAGSASFAAADHALIMIYPNPLNGKKYVVLNSGFTFREDAFLNNSKQIPMLPDWAIIDLKTPAGPIHPGRVELAGFFGERWEWKGVPPK